MEKQYCSYYQARVLKEKTWFVVGMFRNEDHVAFERTMDGRPEILEFFVPESQETEFLWLMQALQKRGYVLGLEKLKNRFAEG